MATEPVLAEPGPWLRAAPLLLVVTALVLGYLAAALRAAAGPRGWSRWRIAAWLVGCAVAAVALSPVLADHDPRTHMARHLLLGMLAPLGLVLAAPVTLLLRVTSPETGRRITRILRSRLVHLFSHPATAALLDVGGLYAVMLTSLHHTIETDPVLGLAVHVHYLSAGYLFTWSIAGPDPAPRRPSMATRTLVLVLAACAHSVLAKLLYADTETLRGAALLMYYGGDLAELALATALFTTWYRAQAAGSGDWGGPNAAGREAVRAEHSHPCGRRARPRRVRSRR